MFVMEINPIDISSNICVAGEVLRVLPRVGQGLEQRYALAPRMSRPISNV